MSCLRILIQEEEEQATVFDGSVIDDIAILCIYILLHLQHFVAKELEIERAHT